MDRVQIDPKVLEVVKYNQMPDQNGFPHPNAHIFAAIQTELERLEKLANRLWDVKPEESKPSEFQMVSVDSSNIDKIGFVDKGNLHGVLRVKFKNNTVYDYFDVPKQTCDALLTAESVGKFLSEHIKGKFKYEQVKETP